MRNLQLYLNGLYLYIKYEINCLIHGKEKYHEMLFQQFMNEEYKKGNIIF